MGGEQWPGFSAGTGPAGSSPHGRGTVARFFSRNRPRRFIPAWAGNSSLTGLLFISTTVHPRMGGEQCFVGNVEIIPAGSSPHGRGTERPKSQGGSLERFIPAWAGNRFLSRSSGIQQTVHPRMGGEQILLCYRNEDIGGSSPHGRGTDTGCCHEVFLCRFIPAWAGNRYLPAL